jgi:hypothetical protein
MQDPLPLRGTSGRVRPALVDRIHCHYAKGFSLLELGGLAGVSHVAQALAHGTIRSRTAGNIKVQAVSDWDLRYAQPIYLASQ